MSVAVATNIAKNDLFFGYDTGHDVANPSNITRFYPGEPTVNLMTAQYLFANQTLLVSPVPQLY